MKRLVLLVALLSGCDYHEHSKDPVHSEVVQAKLDTLYAELEIVRYEIQEHTSMLYDLCVDLALQHEMNTAEAIEFCVLR